MVMFPFTVLISALSVDSLTLISYFNNSDYCILLYELLNFFC